MKIVPAASNPVCRLPAPAGDVRAVITPALLICRALGLPAQDTQHIISMSLFASGVASIIQIKARGPVGSGLLSIQGTSFNFVAPLIMGGTALKTGGADVPTMMAALFGTLMLASCTEMFISRVLHRRAG